MRRIIPEDSQRLQELFLPLALRKSSHVLAGKMGEMCSVSAGITLKSIGFSGACDSGLPGFTKQFKKE